MLRKDFSLNKDSFSWHKDFSPRRDSLPHMDYSSPQNKDFLPLHRDFSMRKDFWPRKGSLPHRDYPLRKGFPPPRKDSRVVRRAEAPTGETSSARSPVPFPGAGARPYRGKGLWQRERRPHRLPSRFSPSSGNGGKTSSPAQRSPRR